jgi:hypothetical protein
MFWIHKQDAYAANIADERNTKKIDGATRIPQKSMYRNAVFRRTAMYIERGGKPKAEKPGENSSTAARVTGVA